MASQKDLISKLHTVHEKLRKMKMSSETDDDYELNWKHHVKDYETLKVHISFGSFMFIYYLLITIG